LLVVPAQVICELFNVLVRKARRDPIDARRAAAIWQDSYLMIPTTETVLGRAFGIAVDHHLATWDAVILAAASEAGCRALLSEDIQDGFTWGGVAVVNPFAPTPHKMLDDLRAGFR
jgi:predicted nucleic acid-binding protein